MEELVRRYRRPLLSRALARTASAADAEDAVQTVLLRVVRRGGLHGIADPWRYLARAVENVCTNLTTRSRTRQLSAETELVDPAPADDPTEAELSQLLRGAIGHLPRPYRTVLWMVHVEGLDAAEVAQMTSTPPSTVRSNLARGRRLLRTRLGPLLRKAGYLDV